MKHEGSIPSTSRLRTSTVRLALIYLLVLSIAMFRFERLDLLAAIALAHFLLYALLKLDAGPLLRIVRRLGLFFAFILLVNAVEWSALPNRPPREWLDQDGLWMGLALSLRVLIVVVASTLVRLSAPPGAFAEAIRSFGLPRMAALAVDGVFDLLASTAGPGSGGGKGTGGGGGGGRGRGRGQAAKSGSSTSLTWSDFRRRRLDALIEILGRSLERARRWIAERAPDLPAPAVRDASLVLMSALAIMSVRFLQVLPGLPIAPGHKNLLIVPLYLFVAVTTRSRFGATQCGLAIGLLSFLFGQGRFGVFEIVQWLLPGLAADLMAPVLRRVRGGLRWPAFALAGTVLGICRFSAGLLMILLAGGHPALFAIYSPFLISQAGFATLGASLTPWLSSRWPMIEQSTNDTHRGSFQ